MSLSRGEGAFPNLPALAISARAFGAALAADAEYGEVVQVCFELILLLEGDPDGLQEAVVVYVQGGAAVPADDVMVRLVVSHFVLVGPTPKVNLDEQTLLLSAAGWCGRRWRCL